MTLSKKFSKLIYVLVAAILVGVGFALSKLPQTKSMPPFPDGIYLDSASSLNGVFEFKGRVVSQLGRGDVESSLRFSVLETNSGGPLDLAVVVPDLLQSDAVLPGQVYRVVVLAKNGNMLVQELEKY